jgi:hypothetical protein
MAVRAIGAVLCQQMAYGTKFSSFTGTSTHYIALQKAGFCGLKSGTLVD